MPVLSLSSSLLVCCCSIAGAVVAVSATAAVFVAGVVVCTVAAIIVADAAVVTVVVGVGGGVDPVVVDPVFVTMSLLGQVGHGVLRLQLQRSRRERGDRRTGTVLCDE